MSVGTVSTTPKTVSKEDTGFNGLTADDFFKLLITQLQNQDPAEPMSNEQMLNQIATIRGLQSDLEMGKALKDLTSALGGQTQLAGQRLSVAASFIGRSVTFKDGQTGMVSEAHLSGDKVMLLANGKEFLLDDLVSINSLESLVGRTVSGLGVDENGNAQRLFGYVSDLAQRNGNLLLKIDAPDASGALKTIGEIPLEQVTGTYTYDTLIGKNVRARTPDGLQVQGLVTAPPTGPGTKTDVIVGNVPVPISHISELLPK